MGTREHPVFFIVFFIVRNIHIDRSKCPHFQSASSLPLFIAIFSKQKQKKYWMDSFITVDLRWINFRLTAALSATGKKSHHNESCNDVGDPGIRKCRRKSSFDKLGLCFNSVPSHSSGFEPELDDRKYKIVQR